VISIPLLRVTKDCCRCGHAVKPGGPSRREFFTVAAAALGAAGLTGISTPIDAVPGQSQNYPPPPPVESPIEDLIDTHAHTGPDVVGRSADDEEALQLCRDKGMGAVVLKNHRVPTADRAWLTRKHVAGIKVFGGIVLNYSVGGINPDAVEWMWRMQGGYGRFVWFPTSDSNNHVKRFNKGAPEGIKVLDSEGKALPAVYEVLRICAKQKLVVNTGHLSPSEGLAVIAAARDVGADRIIVTHAQHEVVNMSVEEMKKAAAMGAKLELIAQGPLMGPAAHGPEKVYRQVLIQETVGVIKAVGAQNFVLGTDLGQPTNPTHADGLQMFVTELMAQGISKDQIKLMGRETAGALLMG
jgi:Family of unknown function (DUF6282)